MRPKASQAIVCAAIAATLSGALALPGQIPNPQYASMAPPAQYMMDPAAEIALARSAAPKSISDDAQVLVLGQAGFYVAASGTNEWACLVQRSWNAAVDFPEFWNPKIRAPICLNPAAVRSVLPIVTFWTKMAMAGQSKEQMAAKAKTAFATQELPVLESGAMSFMMSKDGYLADDNPHFHPHVMFFEPLGEGSKWGANMAGSPVFAGEDKVNRMTILPVPVPRWSDGTLDAAPPK